MNTVEHEYTTQPIRFGTGEFFQATCSCGWVCGHAHRVHPDSHDYQKRSAEMTARGDFEAHCAATHTPGGIETAV